MFYLRKGRLTRLTVLIVASLLSFILLSKSRPEKSARDSDEDDETLKINLSNNRDDTHGVLDSMAKYRVRSTSGKNAFVTLMCDNTSLQQLRTLVYSWKRTKSPYPLVVLTLPWADDVQQLVDLGAVVKKVDYLEVPFKRKNGKKVAFEKICKYSKIHIWALEEYQRLVYLDPTLLIVHNIDELFQNESDFSAVKVVGDDFNTALFVAKPKLEIYSQMLKLYKTSPPEHRGEAGFFNWFFLNHKTHILSSRYNTVVRLKDYAVWPLLKRSAKVFHFSPLTAPWNFYSFPHQEYESNFEPSIFSYWNLIHQQAIQHLAEFGQNSTWPNAKRQSDICNSITSYYNPKRFTVSNKFSVLIGTWDRVVLLRKMVLHYQKSRLVHKIYITWHNPAQRPPEEFLRLVRKKPPVEILTQKYDSLNNRFNPIPNLETKAVLIVDDDIRVNITDLEYGFEVWKNRPQALVGAFPRYHEYHANGTYTYEIKSPERPRLYSIMLTKFMFMSSDYLFDYTCLLPAKIHRYIDEKINCEDIAINLMVSGMTGAKPVAVLVGVDDFGTTSGISVKVGHMSSRSQCSSDLIKLFGRDTLKYNREVFMAFRKRRNL